MFPIFDNGVAKGVIAKGMNKCIFDSGSIGVSILQEIDGVPDRQAVEMLRYHAGWNWDVSTSVIQTPSGSCKPLMGSGKELGTNPKRQ